MKRNPAHIQVNLYFLGCQSLNFGSQDNVQNMAEPNCEELFELNEMNVKNSVPHKYLKII